MMTQKSIILFIAYQIACFYVLFAVKLGSHSLFAREYKYKLFSSSTI